MLAPGTASALTLAKCADSIALAMVCLCIAGCPRRLERAPLLDGGVAASDGSPSGIGLALVVPGAGARDVPTNLERVVMAAAEDPGPVVVRGGDGRVVASHVMDAPLSCEAPHCSGVALDAPLAPTSIYWVEAGGLRFSFMTAAGADTSAPVVATPTLDYDGRCVLVRVASDEPVTIELADAGGSTLGRRDIAALIEEVAVPAPGGPFVTARLTDLAGNVASEEILWQPPPPGAPALTLTEVMAHPRGAQPAQEWVELKNLGTEAVSTAGLVISAGGSRDSLPDALVPAGGYAVVVGAGFALDDGGLDVPPAPGAALLRLASAAIGGGLGNAAGSVIELDDASGRVVSRYGGFIDVSARGAAGQSAIRIDETGCDVRTNWRLAATPTPGAAP